MSVVLIAIVVLLGLIVITVLAGGVRILREYERGVVFRWGRLSGVRGPGFFYVRPVAEKMEKLDLRVVTSDVPPQEAITKDNVTVDVNAVLYYRIRDPVAATVDVENYKAAVSQAAQTTLRSIIGQYDLDTLLRSRDDVNERLKAIIDEMSDPWGIQVDAVETKDLIIPQAMQRAMAKEAEAERERRARLIKAKAEKDASEHLAAAAQAISENPAILELRRMQMISEVGIEQNTTTIILMPSEFVTFAKDFGAILKGKAAEA